MKVFDNLYFVGQSEYSAWAVTTTEGIVLIDTLFDYSVEEEVAAGLKKLGLEPATIRYPVVTHPHPDHHGGAKFLQDPKVGEALHDRLCVAVGARDGRQGEDDDPGVLRQQAQAVVLEWVLDGRENRA